MSRRQGIRIALLAAVSSALLLVPAAMASAAPLTLGASGDKTPAVLEKLQLRGQLNGGGVNERVYVTVRASGRKLFTRKVKPAAVTGNFSLPLQITSCCKYVIEARHGGDRSKPVILNVDLPNSLSNGPRTKYFNQLLRKQGFHMGSVSNRANSSTALGILAFRKVNNLGRRTGYLPRIYRMLLQDRGEFVPREQKQGRYVEVDISHQVMALIENGVATQTFHVSTGASSTPTVRGHFHFYRKEPGYNSHRMYYSVYFIGGYATHGYSPVPTYNASHGCVRNPIPYSRFIYDWIDLGDPIYVY